MALYFTPCMSGHKCINYSKHSLAIIVGYNNNVAILLIIQERYQYMYLTRPSPEWNRSKLSQLCHVDMRLLLFNCLYEAKNPSLYQSVAKVAGNTYRSPPLLHLEDTSMSAFDCLSLGYFLSWVCRTVSSEISVHLYRINGTCIKFLVKSLTEGIREAKSCGDGSLGTLYIHLNYCTWEHDGIQYLTQLLQSSEDNCVRVSGLSLAGSLLTQQDFLCLVDTVGSSKSLRVLSIRYTPLTEEGRLALGKMLHRNTTLRTFNIADFLINEVITDIAEGLKHNSTLETVKFEGNITSIGLKLLAEIIRHNKHLKTFSIKTFSILSKYSTYHGTIHLIEALKRNSTLQNLCVHGINLSVPQLELLANVLTINTTLEKLEYLLYVSRSESVLKAELTALAKRLLASGVLHQLFTIALERTIERFGQQETTKALKKYYCIDIPALNYFYM